MTLHDNWVGGSGNLQLDLISRHEDVQVNLIIYLSIVQQGPVKPYYIIVRLQH